MKKHLFFLSAMLVLFVIHGHSQVFNDSCFKALYVPAGISCAFDTADNIGATAEDTSVAQNPTCGFYKGGDVWFKTVMPASGHLRFEVQGISGSYPQFALYTGTCGSMTQLFCNQLNAYRTVNDSNLAGDTIFLRIYRYNNAGSMSFRYCIWEPPTPDYDFYADAVFFPYDSMCMPDTFTNYFCTDEPGLAPNPSCGFYRGGDVWFKTILPPSGALRVEVSGISGGNPQFAIYSGKPGTFSEIECAQLDGDRTFIDSSLIGDTITVRVFPYSSREGSDFSICIWESPFPVNNNCKDAIFLPYSDTCNTFSYTNKYATKQALSVAPNPNCSFYQGGDVWFKTIMPPNGSLRIEVSKSTVATALYSGECGSMTQKLCNQLDVDKTYLDSSLIGDTVLLRVFTYGSEEGQDFDMCVYEAPIMLNDNCSNATLISADTTIGVAPCDTFTNKYATSQDASVAPNPTCGFYRGGDVWYKVIMPANGYINVSTNTSTKQFAIYKGSCGNLTQLYCRTLDPNGRIGDPGLAGDTIYIRVFSYSSEEGGEFFLKVFAPDPPANDLCANAIALSPGNTVYSNAFATADTAGTAPNPSCGFYRGGDVWFTYQVPSSGYVKISKYNLNAGILPMMQLYSGTCGNLTRIQCAQFGGTIEISDTAYANQKLYLRLYAYSSDEGGSFALCAYDSVCKPVSRYYRDRFLCPCEETNPTSGQLLASSLNRYTEAYKTSSGADSVLVHLLKEAPLYYTEVYDTVCYGSNYFYPDSFITPGAGVTSTTIRTVYLKSQYGCDSTVKFTVDPWPRFRDSTYVSVCQGDDYIFLDGDTAYNVTSNISHANVFTNVKGCDSIFVEYLQVLPIQSSISSDSICYGSNYVFPDGDSLQNITSDLIDTSVLISTQLCDSLVVTDLRVIPQPVSSYTDSVCYNGKYTFPDGDTLFNASVNVLDTSILTSSLSCDSLVIVDLRVLAVYDLLEYDTACFESAYTFPDGFTVASVNSSMTHVSSLSTRYGCDSIIETRLEVFKIDTTILNQGNNLVASNSTADAYQWLDCEDNLSPISGQTQSSIAASQGNRIYALVITEDGCLDTSTCHLLLGTGINQSSPNGAIKVYPNPANDLLNFEGYIGATADVIITNSNGAIVFKKREVSLDKPLDISQLKDGVYLLKINGREDKLTVKFVKE